MSFTIGSAASYKYSGVLDFCLPTWRRHSGAERIDVRLYAEQGGRGKAQRYLRNLIPRVQNIREVVVAAVRDKRRLLLLDADCLTLKDCSEGFSDLLPIGIARWPSINMGVMFLRTDTDNPFVEFFNDWADRAIAHINYLLTQRPVAIEDGDQGVMESKLHEIGHLVDKLDKRLWNYTFSNEIDRDDFEAAKDEMRILHLRFASSLDSNVKNFKFLRDEFPGLL